MAWNITIAKQMRQMIHHVVMLILLLMQANAINKIIQPNHLVRLLQLYRLIPIVELTFRYP